MEAEATPTVKWKEQRGAGGENTAWKENNKSFALGLPELDSFLHQIFQKQQ